MDESAFRAAMDDIGQRQVPYATATALTATAYRGMAATVKEMERVFDRPTRYTLNSLRVSGANKTALVATVEFRDFAGKGTPAAKYIKPQVEGGPRGAKKFEGKLMHAGFLGVGHHLVPTKAAPLDQYGNPSRGQYARILSALGAQTTKSDNSGAKKVRDLGYFWGNPHGMGAGIWQRFRFGHGWALKPMFLDVRTPAYRKRLPFAEVQGRVVQSYFPEEFAAAVQRIAAKFGG
ncbi:hypothetical protein H261_03288 [Paramagnetospirillum caucaseum]|uniref:Uncharacterized protein n=1 Tax=Paramagnetospirillum caucaseum TaxID=1244869 RepID=M2ZAG9_9PROT|nr:hypothetical protein H261_03288 [Paramagnetospirillum caucaseum]